VNILTDITHEARLTSGEISALWTQYLNDSMASCVISYTLTKMKDQNIRSIFEYAFELSQFHLESIVAFLSKEQYPIPIGFSEEDVNLDAPPLFSDTFMLFYLYTMTLHGLNGYSLSVGSSVREDQRNYFIKCLNDTARLYDRIVDTMLQKGIFSRSPFVIPPEKVEIVQKQHFLAGWLGDIRPLTAIEVTNIYYNMQKMQAKVIMELGFSQVAKTKEIKQYLERGVKLCSEQLEVFQSVLTKDKLHLPRSWNEDVFPSKVAPFSEKLMMFHVVSLLAVTVGYYGAALSTCQRRDLMTEYAKLMVEIGHYAEDGMNLMIDLGWVEKPPMINNLTAVTTT
jgi:hypothetical protein